MSFSKMSAICELEQHHGVDLGQSYKAKYFPVQSDGSTDAANIEEELFVVLYFDPYSKDEVICLSNSCSLCQP